MGLIGVSLESFDNRMAFIGRLKAKENSLVCRDFLNLVHFVNSLKQAAHDDAEDMYVPEHSWGQCLVCVLEFQFRLSSRQGLTGRGLRRM